MDQLRDDLLEFIERAIDGLSAILEDLGDELANRRPDLPGANSCFAILTHCLGVMEYWGGEVIAGRSIVRDRPAEFLATGHVADLVERAGRAKAQLRVDVAGRDLRDPVSKRPARLPYVNNGSVLDHVLEEVAQHLGHVEITRDLLKRQASRETGS